MDRARGDALRRADDADHRAQNIGRAVTRA